MNKKTQSANEYFYVACSSSGSHKNTYKEKVQGKKVVVAGIPEFGFFVYKNKYDLFCLMNIETGLLVAQHIAKGKLIPLITDNMIQFMKENIPLIPSVVSLPDEPPPSVFELFGKQFESIFGVRLSKFITWFGFDVIRFDKWLRTPDGVSTKDYIISRYGEEAEDLILAILDYA